MWSLGIEGLNPAQRVTSLAKGVAANLLEELKLLYELEMVDKALIIQLKELRLVFDPARGVTPT